MVFKCQDCNRVHQDERECRFRNRTWMKSRMDDGPRKGQWYIVDGDGGIVLAWFEDEASLNFVLRHLRKPNAGGEGREV